MGACLGKSAAAGAGKQEQPPQEAPPQRSDDVVASVVSSAAAAGGARGGSSAAAADAAGAAASLHAVASGVRAERDAAFVSPAKRAHKSRDDASPPSPKDARRAAARARRKAGAALLARGTQLDEDPLDGPVDMSKMVKRKSVAEKASMFERMSLVQASAHDPLPSVNVTSAGNEFRALDSVTRSSGEVWKRRRQHSDQKGAANDYDDTNLFCGEDGEFAARPKVLDDVKLLNDLDPKPKVRGEGKMRNAVGARPKVLDEVKMLNEIDAKPKVLGEVKVFNALDAKPKMVDEVKLFDAMDAKPKMVDEVKLFDAMDAKPKMVDEVKIFDAMDAKPKVFEEVKIYDAMDAKPKMVNEVKMLDAMDAKPKVFDEVKMYDAMDAKPKVFEEEKMFDAMDADASDAQTDSLDNFQSLKSMSSTFSDAFLKSNFVGEAEKNVPLLQTEPRVVGAVRTYNLAETNARNDQSKTLEANPAANMNAGTAAGRDGAFGGTRDLQSLRSLKSDSGASLEYAEAEAPGTVIVPGALLGAPVFIKREPTAQNAPLSTSEPRKAERTEDSPFWSESETADTPNLARKRSSKVQLTAGLFDKYDERTREEVEGSQMAAAALKKARLRELNGKRQVLTSY